MHFDSWAGLFGLLGSFVASAFALVRLSLGQHRAMFDRFVTFLEDSLRRQENVNSEFHDAIDALSLCVRENSQVLGRMAERLGVNGERP